MNWSVVFLNAAAQAELAALPPDMRAKFEHIVMLVRELGLDKVTEKTPKRELELARERAKEVI
jgi:phage-related protein